MEHFDILIIGAGAAGIGAAKAAWEAGCRSICLADRKTAMGGVKGILETKVINAAEYVL